MPFSKRTYSFRQGASNESENNGSGLSTPLRKIKSRGRTFIGGKTPTTDNSQEESGISLSPFTRGSVRLRSIRKRKMANRDDVKNEGTSFKREKLLEKPKDEIEVKIEENIRMRDGITKLLGGCHDTRQAMDIGKNLLTINSRILSLMSSLQKKRSSNILKDFNKGQGIHEKAYESCFGDLAVSEIRIPLLWKQDAHFKSKAGEQPALLYHMFCLLKINDQVFDTPLVQFNQIDTDVTFNDVFTFHDIHPDFKLEVEVYYSVINNPDNPVWTPIRTPKKNVYSSAPKFCLAAHAQLTVDDVKDAFVVSDFTMGGVGASATAVLGQVDDLPDNPLALWGQFSCQLHARPSCFLKQDLDGHLLLQSSDNGKEPLWEKYYCRLRNGSVQCWKSNLGEDEEFSVTPTVFVALKKNMKLHTETNVDNSGRCLITLTKKGSDKKESVFAFENEEEFEKWRKNLHQAILNIAAWKTENYTLMNLEEFEAKKIAFNKAMNYFDQHKVDSKPISPGLARKVAKNSFYLTEHTPKVKSFYDQIKIEEKSDLMDGRPISVEVCHEKKLFESSTEEKELKSKSDTDNSGDTIMRGGNENVNSLVQKEDVAVVVEIENNNGMTEQHRVGDGWESIEVSELKPESVESTANSSGSPVTAESGAALEKNERLIEGVDSERDEEAVEEDKQPEKEGVETESVAELDDEMEGTEKPRDLLAENVEGTVEESVDETGKVNDDKNVCEDRDVSKVEEKREEVNIDIKKDDDSDLEKEPDETEESVLDYFMETINFAAELDECNDSFCTEESSQKTVDENDLGDDMQTGLSESELHDNVCDESKADNTKPLGACDDYEISSTKGVLEDNQEDNEDEIKMERTDGDPFLVGESSADVDIKEFDADSSHNICVQTDELTEVIPANIETEKELSFEEQDASNIGSNISETEPCQEGTTVLEEKVADKSESSHPDEPVSSPTLDDPSTSDSAECQLDTDGLDDEGVECNQGDAIEVETVKQTEPVDSLSGECELTTVCCTEETVTQDDVTENDNVDTNRKIETDV